MQLAEKYKQDEFLRDYYTKSMVTAFRYPSHHSITSLPSLWIGENSVFPQTKNTESVCTEKYQAY